MLKNGTGEPGGSTLFYNLYLYKNFFTFQNMSYGATLAWLLFAITLVITLILFRTLAPLGLLRGGDAGDDERPGRRPQDREPAALASTARALAPAAGDRASAAIGRSRSC